MTSVTEWIDKLRGKKLTSEEQEAFNALVKKSFAAATQAMEEKALAGVLADVQSASNVTATSVRDKMRIASNDRDRILSQMSRDQMIRSIMDRQTEIPAAASSYIVTTPTSPEGYVWKTNLANPPQISSRIIDPRVIERVKRECKAAVRAVRNRQYRLPWVDMFLSGGFIASCIQGETPRDMDLYFKTQSAMEWSKSTLEEFVGSKVEMKVVETPDYRVFTTHHEKGKITEWAITIDDYVQFIMGNFGTPQDVKKTFDFVHCMPHYDIASDTLYISEAQYIACVNKQLVVNNPGSWTIDRQKKFQARGYKC